MAQINLSTLFLTTFSLLSTLTRSTPLAHTVVLNTTGALFPFETHQLPPNILTNLSSNPSTAPYAHLYAFNTNTSTPTYPKEFCKTFPGDANWPSQESWNLFNKLSDGALIPTTPLAAPCYDTQWGARDTKRCEEVTGRYGTAWIHEDDPTSIMFPIYQGRTCMPPTLFAPNTTANLTCTLGGYPVYAVNATTVAHIQLAVNFARNQDIRLVVKNTGHDYLGKSAGAGSLGVWMHNNKDIEFLSEYEGGPAFKLASGVTVLEVYQAAERYDVSALGGIAPSVGYVGGYFQGGGHTPLSGLYGMAADNVLSINLVLSTGEFITASATSYPDLFWALRGGGGGTYGVVTSIIIRVHPKIPVTTSIFSFQSGGPANVSKEAFWLGVRRYFESHIAYTDAGTYSFYFIFNANETTDGELKFDMRSFFAPNHTLASFASLTSPWFSYLKELGIPWTTPPNTTYYPSYLPAYMDRWGRNGFPVGNITTMAGNRLLPRSHFENAEKFEKVFDTLKAHAAKGFHLGGYHQAPRNRMNASNAVSTAWRETVSFLIFGSRPVPPGSSLKVMQAATNELVNELLAPWKDVATPEEGGGSYLNEAAVMEPGWQESFYGLEYGKMLEIKKRWDPRGLFYGTTAVGSEEWEVRDGERGVQTQDGRLCRV